MIYVGRALMFRFFDHFCFDLSLNGFLFLFLVYLEHWARPLNWQAPLSRIADQMEPLYTIRMPTNFRKNEKFVRHIHMGSCSRITDQMEPLYTSKIPWRTNDEIHLGNRPSKKDARHVKPEQLNYGAKNPRWRSKNKNRNEAEHQLSLPPKNGLISSSRRYRRACTDHGRSIGWDCQGEDDTMEVHPLAKSGRPAAKYRHELPDKTKTTNIQT